MQAVSTIERSTLDLYRSYPYPLTTAKQRRETLAYAICKYKFLGMEEALRGGRVLDAGCGTGRLMNIANHYDMREYVGLDQSAASLAYARKAAEEEGFDHFRPVVGSVFDIPYPDDSFDAVVCWGVLQVTPDPIRGLRELVRVCKPGGFVAIWVYNPFTHWRHNLQKRKINRIAGADIHRRFDVAHRLYGRKALRRDDPSGDLHVLRSLLRPAGVQSHLWRNPLLV